SRRRHTRSDRDWSSDVCSSDLTPDGGPLETKALPAERDVVAPDGSDVRILLAGSGGGLAHFELGPGETSVAVVHRTVEEIWYFQIGRASCRGRGEVSEGEDGVV